MMNYYTIFNIIYLAIIIIGFILLKYVNRKYSYIVYGIFSCFALISIIFDIYSNGYMWAFIDFLVFIYWNSLYQINKDI